MAKVHELILQHVRHLIAETPELASKPFAALPDDQLLRMMFANYRGDSGVQLTHIGLQLMSACFERYEIEIPSENRRKTITPSDLLYLERKTTLPYYISLDRIVVFEDTLGVMLKMVGGDVAKLVRLNGGFD